MKKKTNDSSIKVMITAAVVLIVLAICCAVFLVLDSFGVFDSIDLPGSAKTDQTTKQESTEEPTHETQLHDDVEMATNADGTPDSIIYYKDNIYNGSVYYAYSGDGKTVYETYFDADDNMIESIVYTVDSNGNLVYQSHTDNEKTYLVIEYTYADGADTYWKKTSTDTSGDVETVTKEIYDNNLMTEKEIYEDGVLVSHMLYTYDEEGNLVSEKEAEE